MSQFLVVYPKQLLVFPEGPTYCDTFYYQRKVQPAHERTVAYKNAAGQVSPVNVGQQRALGPFSLGTDSCYPICCRRNKEGKLLFTDEVCRVQSEKAELYATEIPVTKHTI